MSESSYVIFPDVSHHQGHIQFQKMVDAGVIACIHKTSQSRTPDPRYASRQRLAESVGLLWGGYHFGVGGRSASDQVAAFLGAMPTRKGVLPVLDWEPNPGGDTMTREQAESFVAEVQQRTGTLPGLYLGTGFNPQVPPHSILAQCWLWRPRYSNKLPTVPSPWTAWTVWQINDGAYGPPPHETEGIGHCDHNRFLGTEAQLRTFWTTHACT